MAGRSPEGIRRDRVGGGPAGRRAGRGGPRRHAVRHRRLHDEGARSSSCSRGARVEADQRPDRSTRSTRCSRLPDPRAVRRAPRPLAVLRARGRGRDWRARPCTRCTGRSSRRCGGCTRRSATARGSSRSARPSERMPGAHYAGVVYNGDRHGPTTRSASDEKEDFVLFLGRASPEKGWRRAVEAAKDAGERLVSRGQDRAPDEEEEVGRRTSARRCPPTRGAWARSRWPRRSTCCAREGRAVPDRLGRAVRPRDDRGDGVRHARHRDAAGSVPEVIDDGVTGLVVDVEDYPAQAADRAPPARRDRRRRLPRARAGDVLEGVDGRGLRAGLRARESSGVSRSAEEQSEPADRRRPYHRSTDREQEGPPCVAGTVDSRSASSSSPSLMLLAGAPSAIGRGTAEPAAVRRRRSHIEIQRGRHGFTWFDPGELGGVGRRRVRAPRQPSGLRHAGRRRADGRRDGRVLRTLPAELLDGWFGLGNFLHLSIRDADGKAGYRQSSRSARTPTPARGSPTRVRSRPSTPTTAVGTR